MARGRRPTPRGWRIIQGNPQHRPLPPAAESDDPVVMPPWLRHADAIEAGLGELSVAELRKRAAALKIGGRSRMGEAELVDALMLAAPGPRELAWQEHAGQLQRLSVLTATDVQAFAMAIDQYVEYIQLRLWVLENGRTYETVGRNGRQVKRYPEVVDAQAALAAVKGLLIEFGMTPASRTKVDMKPAQDDPEGMEKYLA